ncbi:uncharacterized protein TRAVEDRAFT_22776 [Trametes versicolor FP-101664 SS1]|uniref:uncharacterized protein n=1 Tax=Trametes versicolor (strain FP-101664) TaxID=717944 RepID=UPI000462146D|nr:uncharacterized protein TRAVEDRAFT_22776 [Trametes versicolor FP-101664 SS1]EIW54946.1 hypothetical protein TRAVEDRAFT_22776 [Trametes versicolor FP-101664 SS1]
MVEQGVDSSLEVHDSSTNSSRDGEWKVLEPQALVVYAVVRAFRNRLMDAQQRCNRFCAAHRSASKSPLIDLWWSTLQRCCGIFSRTTKYRTWQAQERFNLRNESNALNIKTAVAAYTTTLEPICLDQMRIVLSGEPGLPLLHCLNALDIATGDGSVVPASFLKRNARAIMSRMLLYALRQMLTVERGARADFKPGWEATVQALFNSYNAVLSGISVPYDDLALRTAFLISMEAKDTANCYTALRYLSAAVDVDSAAPCTYSTVSHVLSAAEQWIENQDLNARSTTLPQINMTAFFIVVHCMLRVVEEKTDVPMPQRSRFERLCARARAALCALPLFLPDPDTLARDATLCDQFSFGLQLLLAPLTRLSRAMDAPHGADTAPHLVDTPSPIHEDVVAGDWTENPSKPAGRVAEHAYYLPGSNSSVDSPYQADVKPHSCRTRKQKYEFHRVGT